MLSITSTPKNGIAIISDTTIKARKVAITTNIENMSCEKGFISRNAVKAISTFFAKIIE
ncbi:hypothetical protein MASR2M47_43210 [Draconibacterium sp.]